MKRRATSTVLIGTAATTGLGALLGLGVLQAAGAGATGNEPGPTRPSVVDTSGRAPLREGTATVDSRADDLTTTVRPREAHDVDGAVEAFVSYATWLVGSPAVRHDPERAPDAVGKSLVNADEAKDLAATDTTAATELHAQKGAYRVLAHSGDDAEPDGVMVEVAAPLTTSAGTAWAVIGGVVTWSQGEWELTSIKRRATTQPRGEASDAGSLSTDDRGRVLDGPGWRTFTAPKDAR